MKLTSHAEQRWRERCAELDPETEWVTARPAGKARRRKIAAQCRAHDQYMTSQFRGFYYLVSANDVVFVMVPPQTVITVFRYGVAPPCDHVVGLLRMDGGDVLLRLSELGRQPAYLHDRPIQPFRYCPECGATAQVGEP